MGNRHYFHNRHDAGTRLAELLMDRGLIDEQTTIIGLLRGGMPIAARIAIVSNSQLGALAVRKLGFPSEPELAFGAIATYSHIHARYINEHLYASALQHDGEHAVAHAIEQAQNQLQTLAGRFASYMPSISRQRVIVCDDGLATGATMYAAIKVLKDLEAQQISIAIPVAPAYLVNEFEARGTQVTCLFTPEEFTAVGAYYKDFSQVDELEILSMLSNF